MPRSLPLEGMLLTGPRHVSVRATYGQGVCGRAIVRRELDTLLMQDAVDAGVTFHDGATVLAPMFAGDGSVVGVRVKGADGRTLTERATVVVAADGRESRLARAARLTHHPSRPRRWAIGAYFHNADVDSRYGEMHVRRGHYVGVAPVPGGLANVCLVVPYERGQRGWREPAALLREVTGRDPVLRARLARAQIVEGPYVLGPMAVDARGAGIPGMLLAGDAAGFIDPITGDGLRLAFESATLAAGIVTRVLSGEIAPGDAAARLAAARRAAFARKYRFNRAVRSLVASPGAIDGAAVAARLWPAAFRAVIRYAGDG
jgi:flavin-dependent dehydrogenase